MLNRNARYQEWLLPYLEGGLDEAQTALLEARLAADPALAAEAERLRQTLGGLRASAARTAPLESAQVPADLWPHLRARLVLDPAPTRRPRASLWWAAGVGAPAAAALFVAAFWLPGWHAPEERPDLHQPSAPAKTAPLAPAPSPARSGAGGGYPGASAKGVQARPSVVAPRPAPAAKVAQARTDPFTRPVPIPAVPPRVVHATFGPVGLSNGPVPADRPAVRVSGRMGGPAPSPTPPPAPMVASPVVTKPMPPAPSPASVTAGNADEAAPATKAAPSTTVNDLNAAPQTQAKPSAPNRMEMRAPPVQALHSTRRSKAGIRYMPAPAGGAAQAFVMNGAASLDDAQASLSTAVQSPLWGENAGEQQANQALMAAREAGLLDDLRARLEAQKSQSPRSLVTGRMLAAVYAFGFSSEAVLRERRRIAGLEGATGEDWFALAQAEEGAHNAAAARAAYRHALESPVPPSAFHAGVARGRV